MTNRTEKYLQKYRCGCFLGFASKSAVKRYCPTHLRDRQGESIKAPTPDFNDKSKWIDIPKFLRRAI